MILENKRKIVSCLLLLNNLRLLCSAYYTGQIVLWDMEAKKPKKIFHDQTTGIYHIEFDERKNLLYTSGFEHEIHVYAPYNDNSCIYKLKGHNSSIKSMALNQEENELITIDIMGNMKVWDLNTSINFQTININDSVLIEQNHLKKLMEQNNFNLTKNKTTNLHLISLQNVKKILIYGEKFLIFEKTKTKNSNLCDDNLILGSLYNSLTNDIITFSNKRVKFWNIFNGMCTKIFEDPFKGSEITAFACDKRLKRFYLGDINGKIKNFNMNDGSFLTFQNIVEISLSIYMNNSDYFKKHRKVKRFPFSQE
jgi:WD40 repeat protein